MTRAPTPARARAIGVIGPADAAPRELQHAERVGALIAAAGGVVVTGGLGGVMEAAMRGAASVDGLTIGVLPGDHPDEANPHARVVVATGIGQARNAILVNSVNAIIAIGRGYGTLSEIALALRRGIRVVAIDSWMPCDAVIPAPSPEEAVARALAG